MSEAKFLIKKAQVYLGPFHISMMEFFRTILNAFDR